MNLSTTRWYLPVLALLALTVPSSWAQYLNSPCPDIFSYRLDPGTNQVFGYIELNNLRIGQLVKLNVDLSIAAAVPQNNIGTIELIKTKEQTFRDIYQGNPAQYRVNFPFRNIIPVVLSISLNGQSICTGSQANGAIVTTINLEHTLYTQLQGLSNNGNQMQPGQFIFQNQRNPTPPVTQTQRPFVYQPVATPAPQRPVQTPQQVQRPTPTPPVLQPQPVQPQTTETNIQCGKPAPRYTKLSLYGTRTAKGQFPWSTPLFDSFEGSKPKYICGSTLISTKHLITAAHCVYLHGEKALPDQLLAVPGMHNIDNFFDENIAVRKVQNFVHHEDYDFEDQTSDYDIAVLLLRSPVVYSELIRPICVWRDSNDLNQIVGTSGFVSGWGVTENGDPSFPSFVTPVIVSKRECKNNLQSVLSSSSQTFCAGSNGTAPCSGDSGSGLVIKRGAQYYIRGLVSMGPYNRETLLCDVTKYTIYTDVAPFRFWLQSKIQGL